MSLKQAAIFDLDGTLWDATTVALPAFRRVLSSLGLPQPLDEQLALTLGYPLAEIWAMLLPADQLHLAHQADHLMEIAEEELLTLGHGKPFPGVETTLRTIRERGYMTFICSNCGSNYLSFTPDRLGIGHMFDARYCAGQYPGMTKTDMVGMILATHDITGGFVIGDRFHDIEAGLAHNLTTVGCAFGTGAPQELARAHFRINDFAELLKLIR